MKKRFIVTAFILSLLTLSACGDSSDDSSVNTNSTSDGERVQASDSRDEAADSVSQESLAEDIQADGETGSNILVAYFSMPEDGTDADAGASRVFTEDGEIQGNVEYFARIIAEQTGADLFRIETVQQYPGDHDGIINQAAEERDSGARPELATHIENLDDYDTIFIGYPIWWYDMPMAMNTFFEEYDFSGKTIIPFSSHGGSGFSGTTEDIAAYEPDANLLDGFTVSREDVPDSADNLISWFEGLDI